MGLTHNDAGEMIVLRMNVREIVGKTVVAITLRMERGEECESLIWLTDKSMGFARAQLRACGFNVDTTSLEEIDLDPKLCAGNKVMVSTEDYKGKVQARIETANKVTKGEMRRLTEGLRNAKSFAEDGEDAPGDAPPPHTDDDKGIPF